MQLNQVAVVSTVLSLPLISVTHDPKTGKWEYSPCYLHLQRHETMIAGQYLSVIQTSHLKATFASATYIDEATPVQVAGTAVMMALDPAQVSMWTRQGMIEAAEDLLRRRQLHTIVPAGPDGKPLREVPVEMASKAREMIIESLRVQHNRETAQVVPTGEAKLSGDVGIGMTKMATGGKTGAQQAAQQFQGTPAPGNGAPPAPPVPSGPAPSARPDF